MNLNRSILQDEAHHNGEHKQTHMYFARHPFVAILLLTMVVISTFLWSEVVLECLAKYLFKVKKSELQPWMMAIVALIFTLLTYFVIVYVFRIPITALL